jgi:AcrR family transcriptional regulator
MEVSWHGVDERPSGFKLDRESSYRRDYWTAGQVVHWEYVLMNEGRRERADAARNRRAILAATEKLLATHRPGDISMEQVAAVAGVGKGTVFHRFGSRMGLMRALMIERAQALEGAVTAGPPPLGEGAPDRDRLLAFVDAIVEVVSRNKSLMAELGPAAAAEAAAEVPVGEVAFAKVPAKGPVAHERAGHPVYRFWHGHISTLIAAQRPDADADMIAHLLLGSLHSEPILAQLATDGPERLSMAIRGVICAVLDAPAVLPGAAH